MSPAGIDTARIDTAGRDTSTALRAGTVTVTVTVRFFAGAKAAAGTASRVVALPPGATVDDLVGGLAADHGGGLARVLASSSFLLDEVAVHDHATPVPPGGVLDVLPPFAGG